MATIILDITEFRQMFSPQFDDTTKWTDALITMTWGEVGCYVGLSDSCGRPSGSCRKILAYNVLAHLLIVNDEANNGGGGTIDKDIASVTENGVSVTFKSSQDESETSFTGFFEQTKYGQKYLSLIAQFSSMTLTVGGRARRSPSY
jgi:hypothetical protein